MHALKSLIVNQGRLLSSRRHAFSKLFEEIGLNARLLDRSSAAPAWSSTNDAIEHLRAERLFEPFCVREPRLRLCSHGPAVSEGYVGRACSGPPGQLGARLSLPLAGCASSPVGRERRASSPRVRMERG